MNEVDEFVHRCRIASIHLERIMEYDPSCRVWMSVFCETMLDILRKQEDPAGASEQLLTLLESKVNKMLAADRILGG